MNILNLLTKSRNITTEEKEIKTDKAITTIKKTVEVIEFHKIEDKELKQILIKEVLKQENTKEVLKNENNNNY